MCKEPLLNIKDTISEVTVSILCETLEEVETYADILRGLIFTQTVEIEVINSDGRTVRTNIRHHEHLVPSIVKYKVNIKDVESDACAGIIFNDRDEADFYVEVLMKSRFTKPVEISLFDGKDVVFCEVKRPK